MGRPVEESEPQSRREAPLEDVCVGDGDGDNKETVRKIAGKLRSGELTSVQVTELYEKNEENADPKLLLEHKRRASLRKSGKDGSREGGK